MKPTDMAARLIQISLLALPFFAAAILFLVSHINSYHQRIEAQLEAELEVSLLLQLAADAETAGRGYTILREPDFLEPLRAARARFSALTDAPLRQRDDLARQMAELRDAVDRRIGFAEDYVADLDRGATEQEKLAMLRAGRLLQDRIRELGSEVQATARIQVPIQKQIVGRYLAMLLVVIGLTTLAALALLFIWRRTLRQKDSIREDLGQIYQSAFEDADIGVAILDADGRIRSANDSFVRMLPDRRPVPAGTPLRQVFPQLPAPDAAPEGAAPEDPGAQSRRQVIIRQGQGDQRRVIRLFLPGLSRRNGEMQKLLVAQDATAELATQNSLRRYERLLEQAGVIAGFAAWSVDPARRSLLVGPAIARLLGLPEMQAAPLSRLRAAMPRHSWRAVLRAGLDCLHSATPFDMVLRLGPAGSTDMSDVQISGQLRQAEDGTRWIEGAAQNVTLLHEQNRMAQRNEKMFRAIARVTNDVVWQIDMASRRLEYTEARGENLPGTLKVTDLDSFIGLLHPEDRDIAVGSFFEAIRSGAEDWKHEFRFVDLAGRPRIALTQAAFIRNAGGDVTHVVGGFQDLTRRRVMQSSIQGMAATVASAEGQDFFAKLLQSLVQGLGADAACIARIDPDGETASTLAVLVDGTVQQNFSYRIAGTICENLLGDSECIVPQDVQELFAGTGAPMGVRAEAYIGGRLTGANGRPIGFLFTLFRRPVQRTDAISSLLQVFIARVEAEIQRIDSERMLREQAELLDHAKEAIVVFGLDGRIRFWNRGAEALYLLPKAQAVGTDIARFYNSRAELDEIFNEVRHSEQVVREFGQTIPGRAGEIHVEESWTLIRSDDGRPDAILKVGSDVSERRRAETRIRELAFFDSLTGLPNRRLFLENLEVARANARSSGQFAALLFLDMDNFKLVNDLHGHLAGDQFLIKVSQTLSEELGEEDFIARLGGDEFVIILQRLGDDRAEATRRAAGFAERIIGRLRRPIDLDEAAVFTSTSIGIALFCDDGLDIKEQLRQADAAMYDAKGAGKNTHVVYADPVHGQSGERAVLIADLRRAIPSNQLELWYQPQFDSQSQVYGAEALLRWRHPERGLVSPGAFIPLVESSGLIVEIGRWVIEDACRRVAEWARDPRLCDIKVSVNVSLKQLRQEDFVDHFLETLRNHGTDPARIMVEVTEGVLEGTMDVAAAKLQLLRSHGIRVSLDDFGTGYSSLSRLRRMPFDEIKIDASFVRDIPENSRDCAIVTSILSLGRTMNMRVVAEGIETERQLGFLREQGCAAFQGYYFARPLPCGDFMALMAGMQGRSSAAAC